MLHPYRMEGYIIPPVSIFYSLNGPDMVPLLLIDAYTMHCLLYCCQRVKRHCEDMPSKLVTERTAGSFLFFVISVFDIHQSCISLARFVNLLVYIYIYNGVNMHVLLCQPLKNVSLLRFSYSYWT